MKKQSLDEKIAKVEKQIGQNTQMGVAMERQSFGKKFGQDLTKQQRGGTGR